MNPEIPYKVQQQINYIAERCKKIKPLVAIRSITYNHEPYLRDTLEGFVMQKTDFPFVAIVHDDASTDGTAKILREYAEKYPDIIFPIYEDENQYSKRDGSLRNIMDQAINSTGAQYVAICEGDDYWIDPLKLQKQVDFLESHPDYGLCYTQSIPFFQVEKKFGERFGGETPNTFKSLVTENRIPTQSILYKNELYQQYRKEIQHDSSWKMGDYPLYLWMSFNSKMHFIPEVTSVYRVLARSASHFSSRAEWIKFRINAFEISLFFTKLYNPELNSIPLEKIFWYDLELALINKDKEKIKKLINKRKKDNIKIKTKRDYFNYYLSFFPSFYQTALKFIGKS